MVTYQYRGWIMLQFKLSAHWQHGMFVMCHKAVTYNANRTSKQWNGLILTIHDKECTVLPNITPKYVQDTTLTHCWGLEMIKNMHTSNKGFQTCCYPVIKPLNGKILSRMTSAKYYWQQYMAIVFSNEMNLPICNCPWLHAYHQIVTQECPVIYLKVH